MINLQMNRNDLKVSVSLEENDGFSVNTKGILNKLEEFLDSIVLYSNVDISIKSMDDEIVLTGCDDLNLVSMDLYDSMDLPDVVFNVDSGDVDLNVSGDLK